MGLDRKDRWDWIGRTEFDRTGCGGGGNSRRLGEY